MKGAEISGRSRNTWSEQKYREELGIYGVSRNNGKKSEYMEKLKYLEEVGIHAGSMHIGNK
jgi:hypothetical protein